MIATGFNRNHMITHEGGTIPEENLTNYVADRVKTTSEVFPWFDIWVCSMS